MSELTRKDIEDMRNNKQAAGIILMVHIPCDCRFTHIAVQVVPYREREVAAKRTWAAAGSGRYEGAAVKPAEF